MCNERGRRGSRGFLKDLQDFHHPELLIIFYKYIDLSLKIIFFLTELKQLVEVRANYARIRRQQGPQATDAVLSPSTKLQSLVPLHSEFLSDPS